MISRTPDRITLIPFKKQFGRELLISAALFIGGGVYGYLAASAQHRGIGWGIAIGAMLYLAGYWLFRYHQAVVFDLARRTVYRKNWWGQKALLGFDEADVLLQSEGYFFLPIGHTYHLVKKADRYTPVQRISIHLSAAQLAEFECGVLAQIMPLMSPDADKPPTDVNRSGAYWIQ